MRCTPCTGRRAAIRLACRSCFLHGGPGGGCLPHHRRFYDPDFFRIVLYDQRGCGASTPTACLVDNTTPHLVADLERLRESLGIERWAVFGGSWGSTLALAYAQAHPDRVLGLVLRGIFLATAREIDWFMHGIANVFPEAWRAFTAFLPPGERDDLLGNYYRRLTDPDPAVHLPARRRGIAMKARAPRSCRSPTPSPSSTATPPRSPSHASRRITSCTAGSCAKASCSRACRHPPHPVHDRPGPLRHGVPAHHRRRACPLVAGSGLHRRAGRRALRARARHHARAGGGGEAAAEASYLTPSTIWLRISTKWT
jgi:pimeloyl-ACP methyl ester carboxylesterase